MSEFVNIQNNVTHVAQPNPATDCWAASFAMLLGTSCEDVAQRAGMPLSTVYYWDRIEEAMTTLGLQKLAPACNTIEGWRTLLTNYGPMWLVIASSYTATISHAIILIGMHGDLTEEGTDFIYLDPGGSSSAVYVKYQKLEEEFEYGSIASAEIVYKA